MSRGFTASSDWYLDTEEGYNASSDEDPDYYPSDNDDSVDNEHSNVADPTHDRCMYIKLYETELMEAYGKLKSFGLDLMGPAFLQLCDFTKFANFCYKNTQSSL